MNNHPRHWLTAPLAELGEIRLGRMLDAAKNRGVLKQYLRNINVRWFGFDLSDLRSMRIPREESEELSVRDGDLFVCEGGEPGRSAVWRQGDNDLAYQKALHRVRPENGLVPEFLMYQLRHHADVGALSAAFTGTTIKHLTRQALSSYVLAIAPTNEQQRIADKLDAVLARVDACREHLDRVPDILKRFRQAVLAAATSGELTEDWRDYNGRLRVWRRSTIGLLLQDIRYGTSKKCLSVPKRTPVLRIPNVVNGAVSHEGMKYAEFETAEIRKLALSAGDILIIRSNGSLGLVGQTAMVTERESGFLFAGYLIRLRVNEALAIPNFVALSLASPGTRRVIEQMARSTSGVNNINIQEIKALPVIFPEIEEQAEIVRRVESLFDYANRLEARYTSARAQVERLTPALLAKAFRGELVPQDPNDEPASVLLERIRAARAAAPAKPKRRRGSAVGEPCEDIVVPVAAVHRG